MKYIVEGNNLSRLYSHLNDNISFAIISSRDKDSKSDRSRELFKEIFDYVKDHREASSWKELEGVYTYNSGETLVETSYVIYGIDKVSAVRIANSINQDSIVWKDENFFGFVYMNGTEENCFSRTHFDTENLKYYASRLISKHNEGNSFFSFKFESIIPDEGHGWDRSRNISRKKILSITRK